MSCSEMASRQNLVLRSRNARPQKALVGRGQ